MRRLEKYVREKMKEFEDTSILTEDLDDLLKLIEEEDMPEDIIRWHDDKIQQIISERMLYLWCCVILKNKLKKN